MTSPKSIEPDHATYSPSNIVVNQEMKPLGVDVVYPVAEYFRSPCDGWPQINLMNFEGPPAGATCWICQGVACGPSDSSFFYPCGCGPVHRMCFHNWRQGWITPKNYFSCPNCMQNYTIERLEKEFDPASQEESRIRAAVRWRLALFWLVLIVVLVASVCIWAAIGWACEKNTKNIPIGISYVLTSVVHGVPDANTTKMWREDFINPDTATWPYYGTFGILLTSICIILLFLINLIYEECFMHYKERERDLARERKAEPCSEQCRCYSSDWNNCCLYCYFPSSPSPAGSSGDCCCPSSLRCCDSACNACWCQNVSCDCCSNCNCDGCGNCGNCGNCGSCDCKLDCGGGGGDGAALIPILCVIVIIVAIAVVLSAVFIVGYFACQRLERYHAWLSLMLYNRQLELNNKMVVVGKGESTRPTNDV